MSLKRISFDVGATQFDCAAAAGFALGALVGAGFCDAVIWDALVGKLTGADVGAFVGAVVGAMGAHAARSDKVNSVKMIRLFIRSSIENLIADGRLWIVVRRSN
jgi:hypothetical protein